MKIVKRGKITYYVKDEAVIAEINSLQYVAYTVYALQNRKPFYDFRKAILRSEENEYNSAVEMIRLAQKYNLRGTASHRPTESEINGK